MDSAYLQRIRFQLQKRVRRLNSCAYPLFHSSLVQFWNYLRAQSITAGILAKLEPQAETLDDEKFKSLLNQQGVNVFNTEAEQLAFAYSVIRYCAQQPLDGRSMPEIRIGHSIASKSKHDDSLNDFREVFLEPLYEYIDDALDQQGAVLSLLLKYKRKVEWFERDELARMALGDERTLAKHLYAYLFDQGLDFHIEPQSASGETDLVASELVLDAKVFDGGRRGNQYLANGVHQVHTYARDFNQEVGYLVVYKICPETIDFTFSVAGQHAPYVTVGGKTIYVFVIDICKHEAGASKRGAMKVHTIDQAFLIREVEAAVSDESQSPAA